MFCDVDGHELSQCPVSSSIQYNFSSPHLVISETSLNISENSETMRDFEFFLDRHLLTP